MRVAAAGGTGVVGCFTVRALAGAGHEAAAVARSHGVDVSTGEGLDEALAGAGARSFWPLPPAPCPID